MFKVWAGDKKTALIVSEPVPKETPGATAALFKNS